MIKRYFFRGVDEEAIKLRLDPSVAISSPSFLITTDVTFNESVSDEAAVDQTMALYGFYPEVIKTLSLDGFIGIKSPDGTIWKLVTDDTGVFSVEKTV